MKNEKTNKKKSHISFYYCRHIYLCSFFNILILFYWFRIDEFEVLSGEFLTHKTLYYLYVILHVFFLVEKFIVEYKKHKKNMPLHPYLYDYLLHLPSTTIKYKSNINFFGYNLVRLRCLFD